MLKQIINLSFIRANAIGWTKPSRQQQVHFMATFLKDGIKSHMTIQFKDQNTFDGFLKALEKTVKPIYECECDMSLNDHRHSPL